MTIQDTFIPSHYHITIVAAGLGGASPDNGFIDHQKPTDYDGFPTTRDNSLAKERANMRYENLIRKLSMEISPIRVLNVTATGADEDTAATQFELTVVYDRPEYLRTEDEENAGTFLTSTSAIRRYVARMLTEEFTENRDCYDPTAVDGIVIGSTIISVTAGDLTTSITTAESKVTVISSDLTT